MPDPNKCIVNNSFGIQHPYAYCVKPSDEMVPPLEGGGFSMKNTGNVVKGIVNYIDYLTLDANAASASECNNSNGGVIGNRYLLKTNIKCKAIDTQGNPIAGDNYLHKYIDNVTIGGNWLTVGRILKDVTGIIPSTFGSATRIGDNVFDVMSAFSGDTQPYCMAVSLDCHVIDKNPIDSYSGLSPFAYVSIDDIKDINTSLFPIGKPSIPTLATIQDKAAAATASASELAAQRRAERERSLAAQREVESGEVMGFYNINDNIIWQNIDKIQNMSEFSDYNLTSNEYDIFANSFYIGFSILLILIMFKLLNKK